MLWLVSKLANCSLTIALGAQHEERDSNGLTAFHCAIKCGHTKLVNFFLSEHSPKEAYNIEATRLPGKMTFIKLAVESEDVGVVEAVIEADLCTVAEVEEAWKALLNAEKKSPHKQSSHDAIKTALRKVKGFKPPKASAPIVEKSQQVGGSSTEATSIPAEVSPTPTTAQVVEELMNMGFSRDQTIKALAASNNSPDLAAQHLFNVSYHIYTSARRWTHCPSG